jgi:hypothetical protein
MATRADETIGFPTILNEMMRRARYAFRPKCAVYARGYGVGLVKYVATLHLGPRMVIGPPPPDFEAWGTSMEMAIQEVAWSAIIVLRHEHPELWEKPFTYIPVRGLGDPIAHVVTPPNGPFTIERCMAEVVTAYEIENRSLVWELEEARRHLVNLQVQVEPSIRTMTLPRTVPNAWPQNMPQEEAPPSHRCPHVVGVWVQARHVYNPISMGLHVRRVRVEPTTRESLLGDPERLSHESFI